MMLKNDFEKEENYNAEHDFAVEIVTLCAKVVGRVLIFGEFGYGFKTWNQSPWPNTLVDRWFRRIKLRIDRRAVLRRRRSMSRMIRRFHRRGWMRFCCSDKKLDGWKEKRRERRRDLREEMTKKRKKEFFL